MCIYLIPPNYSTELMPIRKMWHRPDCNSGCPTNWADSHAYSTTIVGTDTDIMRAGCHELAMIRELTLVLARQQEEYVSCTQHSYLCFIFH